MSSSSICQHFTQNTWKKDLCSNCFKSKDEHRQNSSTSSSKMTTTTTKFAAFTSKTSKITASFVSNTETDNKKTDYPNKYKAPAKSIIKNKTQTATKPGKGGISCSTNKTNKVSFPKNLTEIIGFGGEWSDSDDDDHDFMNIGNERDDVAIASTDDEESQELKRITRANTDFNMNNGNLLGDPQENIKKSFAALKLGAPQVDKEGKKQTLKINVTPFGATAAPSTTATATATTIAECAKQMTKTATSVKAKFETKNNKSEQESVKSEKVVSKQSVTLIKTATKTNAIATLPKTTTVTTTTTSTSTNVAKSMNKNEPAIKSHAPTAPPLPTAPQQSKQDVAVESDGKNSPPIERAMEKSLLDEISETLEQKQNESKKLAAAKETNSPSAPKVMFEITSLSESMENKPFLDFKKPIARNPPITKDHTKPKISVFHKYSDTDSNCSDSENGVSAYYDVVETQISYENMPDGKSTSKEIPSSSTKDQADSKSVYSSSQYITDMLLSSKTRAASYNLHEGNFMTSKITAEGKIVTKCSSDDALDSTGSSFDGSSDEEASYNMIRSESDSGIGISIGHDYKNVKVEKERVRVEKNLSISTNNSDYEDIQVMDQKLVHTAAKSGGKPNFSLEKCRELHGEPDGSADPDGSLENKEANAPLPALPKSPPPTKTIDARPSFLHGLQKQHPPILLKKPDLPAKPNVVTTSSPLKTFFATKRGGTSIEQQVINQLQMVMSKSIENLPAESSKDDAKLRKGRAPNPPPEQNKSSPPPTPERDYSIVADFEEQQESEKQKEDDNKGDSEQKTETEEATNSSTALEIAATSTSSNIYLRKPVITPNHNNNNGAKNVSSPVIREKDKRERATINPKFRSLNTFVMQRSNAVKNLQLQTASSSLSLKQPMTPEAIPRNNKNLSFSQECLAAGSTTNLASLSDKKTAQQQQQQQQQKTKTKFSIKKFLRMGASKTTDNLHKKDGIYSEICTGEETGVTGKPRLVIIHPIDINPTAVEVVKDITKTSDAVTAQTVAVVTTKPPAPPLRNTDSQRSHEINKPARPPPPKSAELRRKQKISLGAMMSEAATAGSEAGGSMKCKSDNVYANLGEIRSSIAPRKPERTASMREREAQLELARKRHGGPRNENADTISICSSNGDNVSSEQQQQSATNTTTNKINCNYNMNSTFSAVNTTLTDGKPPAAGSRPSTFERKKNDAKLGIASKLEIFENRTSTNNTTTNNNSNNATEARPSSLKDSVRKINSTIDSYLKDKREYENMYEFVKTPSSPPPPPLRSVDLSVSGQRLVPPARRHHLYSDTASVASYTRSEYGPLRNYGLTNSLANIPRVISASYCGSEVGDIDIYSPYSYYGSEAGGDVANDINDSVWGMSSGTKNRVKATNRLRMRKGRSVVHKTIEDNYTAVVVANHEALAQVLDQLQQSPIIPPALRALANANLRFEDFTIIEGGQAFVVGKKAFHAALWTSAPVTLALSADCNQLSGVGGELSQLSGGVSGVLNPITEFCDLVPSHHLPLMPTTEVTLLQATISVLPRLQLDTLQSIGAILKNKSQVLDKSNFNFRGSIPNLTGAKDMNTLRNVVSVQNLTTLNEESIDKSITQAEDEANTASAHGMPAFDDVMTREVAFIMLQLINGMKNLQAKAIEEMPTSLSNVVLSKDIENKDAQARLCVLQGTNNDEDEPMSTLCKCAHIALTEMLPLTKMTDILADILQQERAESLSKAKSVLEFMLWGPSDVALSGSVKERELALQRWLDLERATVLHGLVRTRVELTVYDECHLMFLVRSTAKMMNDAAKIVCNFQKTASGPITAPEQQNQN